MLYFWGACNIDELTVGIVSVLAGSGDHGKMDGAGNMASFSGPCGIAVDQRNGDAYVSERRGNRIRKITQQGNHNVHALYLVNLEFVLAEPRTTSPV